jgi:methionine-rich copper-binding protein CopC
MSLPRLSASLSIAALLLGSALSPLAMAHAHLKAQAPAANTTAAAPSELRLSFSEAVEASFSQVTLTDASGAPVATAPPATTPGDAKVLVVRPAAPLSPGRYQVQWRVVSVDTHKSDGTYSFTVGP